MAKIILPPTGAFRLRLERERKRIGFRRREPRYAPPPEAAPASVVWFNESGETAPAHAILRVTGADASNKGQITEDYILKCGKPSTTFSRLYLINGPVEVADDHFGEAFEIGAHLAMYDTAVTPAYGEGFGPKPGEWKLFKGYYGFTILGGHRDGAVLVSHDGPINFLKGRTDAAHAVDTSGTISIYAGTLGSETDTGINVTAWNRFADLAINAWCDLHFGGNGFDLVAGRC